LSIQFYFAQQSGYLSSGNPVSWRDDSALNDNPIGGWYDGKASVGTLAMNTSLDIDLY